MGPVLGLGPEGNMVAHNYCFLQYCNTFTYDSGYEGYIYIQPALPLCLFIGSDDLLRSELLFVGSSFICSRRSHSGAIVCLYRCNTAVSALIPGVYKICKFWEDPEYNNKETKVKKEM